MSFLSSPDQMTAEAAASVAIWTDGMAPEDQAQLLRTFVAVAAGRLAAISGPDVTMRVLLNISAALTGGRA